MISHYLTKIDIWLQNICQSNQWQPQIPESLKSELLIRRHLRLSSKDLKAVISTLKKHQNIIAPKDLYGIHKFTGVLRIKEIQIEPPHTLKINYNGTLYTFTGEFPDNLLQLFWVSDLDYI